MNGDLKRYAAVFFTIAIAYTVRELNLFGLLFNRADLKTGEDWHTVSATPGAEQTYSPQGITFVNGDLVFTNHWNGECSCLYRLDLETGQAKRSSMMPMEATHTSGLCWDGEFLWAVDHESNYLYKLNLERTFASEYASVEKTFETGLRGSSGLTSIEIGDTTYLALSDFLWTIETTPPLPSGTGKTYIFRPEALESGQDVSHCAKLSYSNGGYSQGLTWDGEYLYESLNTVGTNRIEVIDLSSSLVNGTGSIERLGSFEAPGFFVEDLATDGSTLWTTDERAFSLYELGTLSHIKRGLTKNS